MNREYQGSSTSMGYGHSSKGGGGSSTAGSMKKAMKQGKTRSTTFKVKPPKDPAQAQRLPERAENRTLHRPSTSQPARLPAKPVNGTRPGGQTLSGTTATRKQQARAAGRTHNASQQVARPISTAQCNH